MRHMNLFGAKIIIIQTAIKEELIMTFENQGWYMIPFRINDYEKYTNQLSKYERYYGLLECRYIFSYITDLFSDKDDAYIKTYIISNDDIANELIFPHTYNGENYDVTLNDIKITTFKSGIGLIIFNVKFNNMNLKSIADFTNDFKKMHNDKKQNDFIRKRYGNLWQIVQRILSDDLTEAFFFSNRNDNYESFVMLGVQDEFKEENYSKILSQLKHGMRGDVDTTRYDNLANIEVSEYSYIRFGASQNAMVCLINKALVPDNSKEFIDKIFSRNFTHSYFCLYLLLINQRLTLLNTMYKSMKYKDDIDKLQQIQKDLTHFRMLASFNVVSNTGIYQCLYDKIYEVLKIDRLYTDVDEINQKIVQEDEAEDIQREKRVNVLLTGISLLTVFSALVDFSDFFSELFKGEFAAVGPKNIFSIGLLALVLFSVTVYIFVRKTGIISHKKKRNNHKTKNKY